MQEIKNTESRNMHSQLYCPVAARRARNRFALAFLAGASLCLVVPDRLGAVGFRLPNQDPEAIARGNAFAATADNPSAIYYNPAGITQLEGDNIRVGIYVISADTEFTSPSGATAKTDTSLQAVPQIYYVHSYTNVPISVGLGVYAPYGLSLDWGNNSPFNTVAESGSLLYATINPVVAWRATHTLSIAIGPTINYSQAEFKRAIGVIPGDQFKFNGDDTGFGFNAGILWQPYRMWSFGVNYHSATTLDYKGTVSTTPSPPLPPPTSTSASINFPQFVAGGISFRPTTNWNFEFDLDWTEWSVVKQIEFQDPTLGNPAVTLNYRSGFMYEFGATRQLGKGYFASVGYIYSENSSPDVNFNPLIPDANLQLGSVGFGRHGRHWDWAIAYHFAFNGGHTVQNDSNALADGTYKTFNNAFNISTTFKF
jgi:long-chain fatty acid transport protein